MRSCPCQPAVPELPQRRSCELTCSAPFRSAWASAAPGRGPARWPSAVCGLVLVSPGRRLTRAAA